MRFCNAVFGFYSLIWGFEKGSSPLSAPFTSTLKDSTGFVFIYFLSTSIMSNTHFTRLIKAKDKLREFNFRKLPATDGGLFHVDVSDDRGNRLIFKMHKEGAGPWRVSDATLPPWVLDAEEKLSNAIEEQITAGQS